MPLTTPHNSQENKETGKNLDTELLQKKISSLEQEYGSLGIENFDLKIRIQDLEKPTERTTDFIDQLKVKQEAVNKPSGLTRLP